jgi:dienelactone hydrolase
LDKFQEFSRKSISFFEHVFSAILPQGKELLITIILQCIMLIAFWFWITAVIHEPNQYWFFSPGIFIIGLLAALLVGMLAAAVLKGFQFIPFSLLMATIASMVIATYVTTSVANNWETVLVINLWLILPAILLGFGISYIHQENRRKWIYKILGGFFLLSGSLSIIGGIIWILLPGFSENQSILEITDHRKTVAPLQVENPATPGKYAVMTLTYGTNDKMRSEFAEKAEYTTEAVDGSIFLPSLDPLPEWLFRMQWGFDNTKLPINGMVWYPQGDGPFPLVLIVHGNHTALDYSDKGYAYLGELLASRGYIVVSIDENFLNSTWINSISNDYSHQENDARGWLLLKHLEQFRKWSHDNNNIFYNKIDWDKIALIGHSRGGEAITEAANFNALGIYPDNGNVSFPAPFTIRSLIAIAPVDNQYNPASKDTPIKNIDYLVIQGSADADLKNFPGQAAYTRVDFGDNSLFHFKSSLYLHNANHGQFNTSWGSADNGKLSYYLLDRKMLLDETLQQQAAQVLISAFLEASLNQNAEYRSFFQEPRRGTAWLADVTLWSQYADSTEINLVNFEEDINLHSGSIENSTINAKHFDIWRENILYGNRNRAIGDSVVNLIWSDKGNQAPVYEIVFSEPFSFSGAEWFSFSTAVANNQDDNESANKPIQFSIELSDGKNQVRLSTEEYTLLHENPQLSLMKAQFMNSISGSDPVMQTIQIPIADFQQKVPDLDISSIHSIHFIFDQTPQGKIWLDNIAIR